jgi:hypothetical protein
MIFEPIRSIDANYTEYAVRTDNPHLKYGLFSIEGKTHCKLRHDVFLEYLCHTPPPENTDLPLIFCVRDPRDSIYSLFKYYKFLHDLKDENFASFTYDYLPVWISLICVCLEHKKSAFFRFEDIKLNPQKILTQITTAIGENFSESEIIQASQVSDYDLIPSDSIGKIEYTECGSRAYEAKPEPYGGDIAYKTRPGAIGKWRYIPKHKEVFNFIYIATTPILKQLGYVDASDKYIYEGVEI